MLRFDGRQQQHDSVKHIVIESQSLCEKQATELKSRIVGGEMTFADAAKEFSTCPSAARGRDLGTFKRGAMVPEFDSAVFDVESPMGVVLGPVKTQFGHHLIVVDSRAELKEK